MRSLLFAGLLALGCPGIVSVAMAGEADVLSATAERAPDGTWRISATVRHDDTGWDHYADAWEVVSPDGTVLAQRVLLHPHVGEQPFTRSQGGIVIPADVDRVTIRARDSVHGYGGATVELVLPR